MTNEGADLAKHILLAPTTRFIPKVGGGARRKKARSVSLDLSICQ